MLLPPSTATYMSTLCLQLLARPPRKTEKDGHVYLLFSHVSGLTTADRSLSRRVISRTGIRFHAVANSKRNMNLLKDPDMSYLNHKCEYDIPGWIPCTRFFPSITLALIYALYEM
jgi:hypothetical protein